VNLPLPQQPQMPMDTSETEFHVSLTEPDMHSAPGPDNIRVFLRRPAPPTLRCSWRGHVTRLLAEARQQIQAAAREAAGQAVSAERRISTEQWEHKVAEAREALSKELSGAIDKIHEESETRSRAAHDAAATALQEDLPKRLIPQLEEIGETTDLAPFRRRPGAARRTRRAVDQRCGNTQ